MNAAIIPVASRFLKTSCVDTSCLLGFVTVFCVKIVCSYYSLMLKRIKGPTAMALQLLNKVDKTKVSSFSVFKTWRSFNCLDSKEWKVKQQRGKQKHYFHNCCLNSCIVFFKFMNDKKEIISTANPFVQLLGEFYSPK